MGGQGVVVSTPAFETQWLAVGELLQPAGCRGLFVILFHWLRGITPFFLEAPKKPLPQRYKEQGSFFVKKSYLLKIS